ncbi:MAG: hypothetical protein EBU09_09900 [Betaproteobacteria bacterium]|nr:hypothetical protein [Betaproteobacteria bacterium]
MLKAFPIVLALAILCAAMAREVKAWGFELHELIARQAQAMLSQQAKTMLESLLAQEEGARAPEKSTRPMCKSIGPRLFAGLHKPAAALLRP